MLYTLPYNTLPEKSNIFTNNSENYPYERKCTCTEHTTIKLNICQPSPKPKNISYSLLTTSQRLQIKRNRRIVIKNNPYMKTATNVMLQKYTLIHTIRQIQSSIEESVQKKCIYKQIKCTNRRTCTNKYKT